MAYVCVPGLGSTCWDSSICNDLSNKGRIQDCARLCISVIPNEFPNLGALALKIKGDDELLLSLLLATLITDDKMSESDLTTHSDQRRSYSMEHFRWGKPTGRKRRPIKVFASSLEGGGSSEGFLPLQARRQLSSREDEAKGDLNGDGGLLRVGVRSKPSPQERKDGTYRMSHFRWGSPPVSKRNGSFIKMLEEKPPKQLAKLFRNIMVKDVQRIMG